jgi:hypothetical protein
VSLQRREFFAILGICAASAETMFAQHRHGVEDDDSVFAAYRPRALTQPEYELLDQLTETLLPADQTGPGAHEAHVAYYVDVVLYHSSATIRQTWKTGLALVEKLADERFGQGFGACSRSQRQDVMAAFAKNEMAPQTDADRFFVEFKRMAIDGFYASQLIQREHLGYRGNTAIPEFPGCTHTEFEHLDTA